MTGASLQAILRLIERIKSRRTFDLQTNLMLNQPYAHSPHLAVHALQRGGKEDRVTYFVRGKLGINACRFIPVTGWRSDSAQRWMRQNLYSWGRNVVVLGAHIRVRWEIQFWFRMYMSTQAELSLGPRAVELGFVLDGESAPEGWDFRDEKLSGINSVIQALECLCCMTGSIRERQYFSGSYLPSVCP